MGCEHDQQNDETRQIIERNIEEHGCFLALFEEDNYLPSFAYSIGLYEKFGHPEICCFGLQVNLMRDLINHAVAEIKQDKSFLPDNIYAGFINGYDVAFVKVEKEYYPSYFGYGTEYYGNSDFPMIQLVWPDKDANFPWGEGFNPDWKFRQPLLDRNTDFFFYEERNLGVYTTQDVLSGEPILYVYHNRDGDWQFHSSLNPDLGNARLVALEQLVRKDKTLNGIYHLQYGWKAWRASKNDEWEYEEDLGTEE